MNCAHRYIDKYSDPSTTVCEHEEGFCDLATLGSLTRAFKSIGVYPAAPGQLNMSLGHIKTLIAGVPMISPKDLYIGKVVPGCCESQQLNLTVCSQRNSALDSYMKCSSCSVCYAGGTCHSCHQPYKAVVLATNHLPCIPLAAVQVEMEGIMDKITGLQYSDCVRSTGSGQTTTQPGADVEDLWESLVFE